MISGAVGLLAGIEGGYILLYSLVYRLIRKAYGMPSWEKEALANKEWRERNEKKRRPSGLKQLLSFGQASNSPSKKKAKVMIGGKPALTGASGAGGKSADGSSSGGADGSPGPDGAASPGVLLPQRRKSIAFSDVFHAANNSATAGASGQGSSFSSPFASTAASPARGSLVGGTASSSSSSSFSMSSPLMAPDAALASLPQKPRRPSVAFPGLASSSSSSSLTRGSSNRNDDFIVSNGFAFSRSGGPKLLPVAETSTDGGSGKTSASPVTTGAAAGISTLPSAIAPVPSPLNSSQKNPLTRTLSFDSRQTASGENSETASSPGGFGKSSRPSMMSSPKTDTKLESTEEPSRKTPPPPPPRPSFRTSSRQDVELAGAIAMAEEAERAGASASPPPRSY